MTGDPEGRFSLERFSVEIPDRVLADLMARIRNTRWPDPAPGRAWEQGTDIEYLRGVIAYWVKEFDWRGQERELNRFQHFRTRLDDVHIYFIHERARCGQGIPRISRTGGRAASSSCCPWSRC